MQELKSSKMANTIAATDKNWKSQQIIMINMTFVFTESSPRLIQSSSCNVRVSVDVSVCSITIICWLEFEF